MSYPEGAPLTWFGYADQYWESTNNRSGWDLCVSAAEGDTPIILGPRPIDWRPIFLAMKTNKTTNDAQAFPNPKPNCTRGAIESPTDQWHVYNSTTSQSWEGRACFPAGTYFGLFNPSEITNATINVTKCIDYNTTKDSFVVLGLPPYIWVPVNQTSEVIWKGPTDIIWEFHRKPRAAGLIIVGTVSLLSLIGTTVTRSVLGIQQAQTIEVVNNISSISSQGCQTTSTQFEHLRSAIMGLQQQLDFYARALEILTVLTRLNCDVRYHNFCLTAFPVLSETLKKAQNLSNNMKTWDLTFWNNQDVLTNIILI